MLQNRPCTWGTKLIQTAGYLPHTTYNVPSWNMFDRKANRWLRNVCVRDYLGIAVHIIPLSYEIIPSIATHTPVWHLPLLHVRRYPTCYWTTALPSFPTSLKLNIWITLDQVRLQLSNNVSLTSIRVCICSRPCTQVHEQLRTLPELLFDLTFFISLRIFFKIYHQKTGTASVYCFSNLLIRWKPVDLCHQIILAWVGCQYMSMSYTIKLFENSFWANSCAWKS